MNNEEKMISIVVPVYNVEQYLPRCIDSLLAQTYQNLEIILVDDGATDRCPEICDEYQKKDKRIKVIHKENGGLSDARNAGTKMACGEYIGYVDSDDFVTPDMYETLAKALEEKQADIAVCNYLYVDEEGMEIAEKNKILPIEDIVLSGKETTGKLIGENYAYWVTAWNRLYRREIACAVTFPKGKIHEDEYTAHMFYDKAAKVAGVSKACYRYVVRQNSIMTKKFSTANMDYVDALKVRIAYYVSQNMLEEAVVFTKWMQRYLIKIYNRLDKTSAAMMDRYTECWKTYRAIRKEMKEKASLGVITVAWDVLFKVAPGVANAVYRRVRS